MSSKLIYVVCIYTDWTDFNASFVSSAFTLTFLPNDNLQTFSVWLVQDNITEGIECLYIVLETINEFVDIPYDNNTITVCIQDDDGE